MEIVFDQFTTIAGSTKSFAQPFDVRMMLVAGVMLQLLADG
jgi:hypothetical protein